MTQSLPQDFGNALDRLEGWFERQKRMLPWRDDPSLYRVWVSEIMLQQTQVVTVIPYFERFMGRFPTVESLAEADSEEVMKYWAGLGYYSRARNLHRGAQTIVAKGRASVAHGRACSDDGFPRDRAGWLEIPGVGEYTAGAILSIALGQPEAILDGNVERVLSRARRVSRLRGDAAYKARLWRLSRAFVVRAFERGLKPSAINQALMELGATTCSVRSPKCLLCPLQEICQASRWGEVELFPPKKKRKEWIEVSEELHCFLDGEGRCLVQKRVKGEWRAGLWDLLSEERPGWNKLGVIESRHVVTRHKIIRKTHVWVAANSRSAVATWSAAEVAPGESVVKWVNVREPEVPIGSALKKVWQQIAERFPRALQNLG